MRLSATLMTYNEEKFIEMCLEQYHPHVDEIIVLDGGSTDNTVKILQKFKKVRYHIIPQPNDRYGGGWHEGDRLNVLKDMARGEWLISSGIDELFDDAVWENLDKWLNDDRYIGYGFYRINYYYGLEYHKPIAQPPNGGEVRIYRNLPGLYMETHRNHHNYRKYQGVRLYDHPKVINTKYLIHHLHRIDWEENSAALKTMHKTADNKYIMPIKYPKLLYEKGFIIGVENERTIS